MRSCTVFQFTQRAIENRSTCHAWHSCRRLPTPGLHIACRKVSQATSECYAENELTHNALRTYSSFLEPIMLVLQAKPKRRHMNATAHCELPRATISI
jgi:hypothetical protein